MNEDRPPMQILQRSGRRPFPPRISQFSVPFWDALAAGYLNTTSCRKCGRLSFPPRPICRACWSRSMAWRSVSPNGTLYTCTRIHVLPDAFLGDGLDQIGIVDLSDGVRLMCRLIGETGAFEPDLPIEMVVLMYEDGPLFAARPA